MGQNARCAICGGEFAQALPWDLCPRCLLQAEVEETPTIEVRCPYCSETIPLSRLGSVRHVACPKCQGRFVLIAPEERSPDHQGSLGRFDLLEIVGAGSFGTVWKAWDPQLGRTVAVKVPHRHLVAAGEAEAILREARTAAQLSHPGIVAVHEVGSDARSLFIVSDFIEGVKLDEWLKTHSLSFERAARLGIQIAEALHYAHEAGVVHRDLKPSNILIDGRGEPHVLDFGLAKCDLGELNVTLQGKILGTPAYMPPEQARGDSHQADRRADVYALGVILFELLSGEKPFRGSPSTLLHQVLHDDPPALRKLNHRIPRDLETICAKCLEKEPRQRYESARELAEELQRFLRGELVRARPVTPARRAVRWCARNPLAASLGGILAAVLVALAIVGPLVAMAQTRLAHQEARQRERAEEEKARAGAIYREAARHHGHALEMLVQLVEPTPPDSESRWRLADHCNTLAGLLVSRPADALFNPADALVLAKVAVTQMPEDWRYWQTLGIAQYRTGEYAEALKTLQTAQAKASSEDDQRGTYDGFALIYWAQGQLAEVQQYRDRARACALPKPEHNQWVEPLEAELDALLTPPNNP